MSKFLILFLVLSISITKMIAGEFITPENNNYFYGRSYTIQYNNDKPSKSSMYYFAYSMDDGLSWKNITEPKGWDRDLVQFTVKVKDIGSAKIGIFCNINNEWINTRSFKVIYKYSKDFQFLSYPDTLFNHADHNFSVLINPEEAPEELLLSYTVDNGSSWRRWLVYSVPTDGKSVMTFSVNTSTEINKNAKFRLSYEGTTNNVCETPVIPFKEKETFFKILNKWGQREIGTNEAIEWNKSDNFRYVRLSTYFDNVLIYEYDYYEDNFSKPITFQKNGEYLIVGSVNDGNWSISQSASFTVGDPCDLVKKQGILFRDSCERTLTRLNDLKKKYEVVDSLNIYLSNLNDSLDISNLSLKTENEKLILNISKIRKDSINLKLIYYSGTAQTIKDESLFSKAKSIYAEITDQGFVYVVFPLELRNETLETTWWCFSMTGELLDSGFHPKTPVDVLVRKELAHGMYIFYTYQNGKYIAYKFII